MYISPMTKRLWWKDSRELLPLVLALLAIASLFLLMTWESHSGGFVESLLMISLFPPMLFSLAAGVTLIGREKETRTLTWLSSLPIPARQLIGNKFAIGIAALVLLWILTGLFHIAISIRYGVPLAFAGLTERTSLWLIYSCLSSFYLLLCGYATAWTLRSPFVSLIAILPLAPLPSIASYLIVAIKIVLSRPQVRFFDVPDWLNLLTLLVGIACAGSVACYAASRNLAGPKPLASPRSAFSWQGHIARLMLSMSDAIRSNSMAETHAPTSMRSLLWQFRSQNRLIIYSLYAILFISFTVLLDNPLLDRDLGPLVWFAPVCAVCWMSILSFQGDNLNNRIRFLAERGVSPQQVWLSRLAFPFVFACIAMVLYTITLGHIPSESLSRDFPHGSLPFDAIFTIGILFAVSQWVGQLLKRLANTSVAAPLIAFYALGVAKYLVYQWETPILIPIGAFIVVPLVATYLMTRQWMDGRVGLYYWLRHAGFSTLALAILCVSYAFLDWQSPGMSDAQQRSLYDEAKKLEKGRLPLKQIAFSKALAMAQSADIEVIPEVLLNESDWLKNKYEFLLVQCDDPVAFQSDNAVTSRLVAIASKLRLMLNQLPSDDSKNKRRTELISQYQDWLLLIQKMVAGLRRSLEWSSQAQADRLEIFLVAEMERPETVARLNQQTIKTIAKQISDRDARWEARRRALILSWHNHDLALIRWQSPNSFGDYPYGANFDLTNRLTFKRQLELRRKFDHLVASLIDYIAAAKQGHGTLPIQALTDAFTLQSTLYGTGIEGPYWRIDDVNKFRVPTVEDSVFAPANQWGAGWEEIGRKWAGRL